MTMKEAQTRVDDRRTWAGLALGVGATFGLAVAVAAIWGDALFAWGVLIGAGLGVVVTALIVRIAVRRMLRRLLAIIDPSSMSHSRRLNALAPALPPFGDLQSLVRLAMQRERQHGSDSNRAAMGRELHHRLRNSLQIINSLLSLQISYETNSQSAIALRRTLLRSLVIGIVYRSAETEEPGALIDFQTIVIELVEQAQRIFTLAANRPSIGIDVQTPALAADTAIPMALVLAEILIVIADPAIDKRGQFCRIHAHIDPLQNGLLLTIVSPLIKHLATSTHEHASLTHTMLSSCASQMHAVLDFPPEASTATCRLLVPLSPPRN